jgi:hypothetical protein
MSLALDDQKGTGSPAALIESGLSACAANCEKDGGTTSSNPLSSSGESVSPVDNGAAREKSRAFATPIHGWRRETGWADRKPALSDVFSLTGIDEVPPGQNADHVQ